MKLRLVYHLQGNAKYLLFGIIFGTVAIVMNRMPHWLFEPFESQKNWIRTTAQIDSIAYIPTENKYEHWVGFQTNTGANITAKSNTSSSILPVLDDTYYVMYNPANPQEFFNNDLAKNQMIFKISGFMTFVFGSIALFVLAMLAAKEYYQIYKPALIPVLDFWIEIIAGSMGALAFAIPALFIDVLLWYFTGSWSHPESPAFIVWIFRILGLTVLVALLFMVKYFYKQRPKINI